MSQWQARAVLTDYADAGQHAVIVTGIEADDAEAAAGQVLLRMWPSLLGASVTLTEISHPEERRDSLRLPG